MEKSLAKDFIVFEFGRGILWNLLFVAIVHSRAYGIVTQMMQIFDRKLYFFIFCLVAMNVSHMMVRVCKTGRIYNLGFRIS